MQASENDRTTHATKMVCFFAGGLIGAAVTLLLAPQSGKSTRDAMTRKLHDAADSARGWNERVIRRGEAIRDEAERRVSAATSALAGNGADEVVSV